MSAPDPKVVALLAEHDDPTGWTGDDADRSVYECLCGDRSPALDHDYITPADIEVAIQWHRTHVAQVLADAGIGAVVTLTEAEFNGHGDLAGRFPWDQKVFAEAEVATIADARVAAVAASVLALADEADARPGGPGCPTPHWVDTDSLRAAVESTDAPAALARVKAEALRDWIAEWPTSVSGATFLDGVARDGLARADRIEAEAGDPS